MFLEALRGGFTCISNFAVLNEEKAAAVQQAASDVGIRLISTTGWALPMEHDLEPDKQQINTAIDSALIRAEARPNLKTKDDFRKLFFRNSPTY
jgi:cytosine/adenosine deaminase-related metal-dependent hydrolase